MNTKNVKVTMKNSKVDMLRFLEAVQQDLTDGDLSERVQYTLDNADKSKKSEVYEVVEEVQSSLMTMTGDDFKSEEVPAPVENEVKKTLKKPKDKKSAPTENEVKTAKKPKVSPATNKTEKAVEKSEKTDDKKVKTTPQLAGNLPIAAVFPEKLDVEGLGVLSVASDKYKTMEDIATALENGKQFYFVTYWTKRQIKEYYYADTFCTNAVKEFPNDLDILEPCYYCNGLKRIWTNSLYTEAMVYFESSDIEHVEDTNPYNGEKFKVRVSNGMEFELYELLEQATAEE